MSIYTGPFPLGIRIEHRMNMRETGSNIISYVEPMSPAYRVGIKSNSRILMINGLNCEDKNLNFVLFFMNLLLRKSNLSDIELTVEELINQPRNNQSRSLLQSQGFKNDNMNQIKDDSKINENIPGHINKEKNKLREGMDQNKQKLNERLDTPMPIKKTRPLRKRKSVKHPDPNETNHTRARYKIVQTKITMSSSRIQCLPKVPTRSFSAPDESELIIRSNARASSYDASSTTKNLKNNRRPVVSFNLLSDAPIPRLCRVRTIDENAGFTICSSNVKGAKFKVNYVGINTLAAHSGLQNDDYIIEISGEDVESMGYEELVHFIMEKKKQDDLQILVVDKATLDWYNSRSIPISSVILPRIQYIEILYNHEILAALDYDGL